jgi:hypothetical protein
MTFDGLRTMYDVCESDNVLAWNSNQYAFDIVNPVCPPGIVAGLGIMPIVCFTIFPTSKLGRIWKIPH